MIIGGKYIDGTTLASYVMYDVHTHLIPEVDDGAWDIATADSMLSLSSMEGISQMIATPHSMAFDFHADKVYEKYEQLQKLVGEKYKELQVHLGCEVRCAPGNIKQVIEKLTDGTYPTLAGSNYVLVEYYTNVLPDEAKFCASVLLKRGWIPVVAHIERYKKLFGQMILKNGKDDIMYTECLWTIQQLKSMGCLMQMNAYDVCQAEDEVTTNLCKELLSQKLIDFLGTDAHDCRTRPPRIEICLAHLYKNYEDDYVNKIAYENAKRYLFEV